MVASAGTPVQAVSGVHPSQPCRPLPGHAHGRPLPGASSLKAAVPCLTPVLRDPCWESCPAQRPPWREAWLASQWGWGQATRSPVFWTTGLFMLPEEAKQNNSTPAPAPFLPPLLFDESFSCPAGHPGQRGGKDSGVSLGWPGRSPGPGALGSSCTKTWPLPFSSPRLRDPGACCLGT